MPKKKKIMMTSFINATFNLSLILIIVTALPTVDKILRQYPQQQSQQNSLADANIIV
ncbi:MAG: hypothetical protein ACTHL3_02010 [Candidatus Nitrosocosmicus sp.]